MRLQQTGVHSIFSRVISLENARTMLSEGTTPLISGFVSKKSGKEFSAKLAVEDGKVVFKF